MVQIVPDFHKHVMAVERIERLLRGVTDALNQAGLLYAVVGGNAVAAWVSAIDEDAVRATKDVDLLVRRADLNKLAEALDPLGLDPAEVLGVHMFVERKDPSPKRGVHLVIAGERIRPEYKYPAPDVTKSDMTPYGYRVLDLLELVKMKLQAFRAIDRAHLVDMNNVKLITPAIVAQLPEDLKLRLQTALQEG